MASNQQIKRIKDLIQLYYPKVSLLESSVSEKIQSIFRKWNLSQEEYAVILYGLRLVQRQVRSVGYKVIQETAEHFMNCSLLTEQEIDQLCERINMT